MSNAFYRRSKNQATFIHIAVTSKAKTHLEMLGEIRDKFPELRETKRTSISRNINSGLKRFNYGTIRDIWINKDSWPKDYSLILEILKSEDPLPNNSSREEDSSTEEENRFYKEFEEFVSNDLLEDFEEFPRRYTYSPGPQEGNGTYTFYPYKAPSFRLHEKLVQFMKRAYVNKPLGLGWTYDRICRYFKVNRKQFHFIKTELGWTHDSDEFTREEVLRKSVHQLMDDREQTQRWILERQYAEQLEKENEKYIQLGKNVELQVELVAEALKNFEPKPVADLKIESRYKDSNKVLINFLMSDAHFGKSEKDEAKVIEVTNELIRDAATMYGSEAKVMLTVLGDWFQIDSTNKTTTRGTKVPTKHHNFKQIMRSGVDSFFNFIWTLQSFWGDNVCINMIPGNHDNTAVALMELFVESVSKMQSKELWLPKWENIIEPDGFNMKAFKHGKKLIVSEHGDGMKGSGERLSLVSMNKHRKLWADTDETFVYTGHKHTWRTEVLDRNGVIWFSLPSPSSGAEYEDKEGYVSRRMIHAHVYHEEDGLINILPRMVSTK